MAAEKVVKLGLERDYKTYLYYIDAAGSVCRKPKNPKTSPAEVVAAHAVAREKDYLYFLDKEGDISRSPRATLKKKEEPANV